MSFTNSSLIEKIASVETRSMDGFERVLDDDDDGVTLASSPVRVSWRVFSLGFSPVRMAGIGKESGMYMYTEGRVRSVSCCYGCGLSLKVA